MAQKKESIKIICKMCGKVFYVNPYRGESARCCSRSCNSKLTGKIRYANRPLNCKCEICGKMFHRNNCVLKQNKHNFCSNKCRAKGITKFNIGEDHPRWKGGERNRTFKRYSSPIRSKRGFTLTKDEFLSFWQKPCHYCGSNISTIGLDRINNDKGYELSNVVSCCDRCNRMKLTMTVNDFMNHICKIYKHLKVED